MSSKSPASSTSDSVELGFRANSDVLLLRAISTGCTRKEDFSFLVDENATVSATRVRPDRCRARAHQVLFEYTFTDLGIDQEVFVKIQNSAVDRM